MVRLLTFVLASCIWFADRCVDSTPTSPADNGNVLVIHAMHGLSNRIRAVSSALDQARKSKRRLAIIWERDTHVDCPFEHLLSFDTHDVPITLIDKFEPAIFPKNKFDVYDYMGEDKNKAIDFDSSKPIYVRSAYRLVSELWSVPDEDDVARQLKPSAFVQRLVDMAVESLGGAFAGVHVRNLDPRAELPDLPDNEYKNDDWKLLTEYRAQSNTSAFANAMKKVESTGLSRFYVAADKQDILDNLSAALPASTLFWTDNGGCGNRSCKCLQYALADLMVLSKAEVLLGSYWSSYSEVAGMIAGKPVQYVGGPSATNDST